MSMGFGQIGEIYRLQKEAREMQNKMKQVSIQGESKSGEIVIKMNGLQEIEDIDIAEILLNPNKKDELIKQFKQASKDAQKKLQKEMAKDMDIGKLKGILGM